MHGLVNSQFCWNGWVLMTRSPSAPKAPSQHIHLPLTFLIQRMWVGVRSKPDILWISVDSHSLTRWRGRKEGCMLCPQGSQWILTSKLNYFNSIDSANPDKFQLPLWLEIQQYQGCDQTTDMIWSMSASLGLGFSSHNSSLPQYRNTEWHSS